MEEVRKRIRVKTGRRKGKKRMWKHRWVVVRRGSKKGETANQPAT